MLGGAAAGFAARIYLSLSSIRCKLMLLFPERLGNRFCVELWNEEWDHRDGHGTASSLMASAVARAKSQDAFWGAGTTASLGPGGAGRERLSVCAGQKVGTAIFPFHVFLSTPVRELSRGAPVGSSRVFARSLLKQLVKATGWLQLA